MLAQIENKKIADEIKKIDLISKITTLILFPANIVMMITGKAEISLIISIAIVASMLYVKEKRKNIHKKLYQMALIQLGITTDEHLKSQKEIT